MIDHYPVFAGTVVAVPEILENGSQKTTIVDYVADGSEDITRVMVPIKMDPHTIVGRRITASQGHRDMSPYGRNAVSPVYQVVVDPLVCEDTGITQLAENKVIQPELTYTKVLPK